VPSLGQSRAASVFANAVFQLGQFAWKMILVGALMGLVGFAALVLVGLARAVIG
jgi:hypothetical protein